MIELLGWASSLILLATIVQQLRKQIAEGSSRGVSKWLFIGQTAASLGFTAYSALLQNWVFTVTNGLLLISGITGCLITLQQNQRRRAGSSDGNSASVSDPRATSTAPAAAR
jgi:uncharacterized protein with PQ loop repeat